MSLIALMFCSETEVPVDVYPSLADCGRHAWQASLAEFNLPSRLTHHSGNDTDFLYLKYLANLLQYLALEISPLVTMKDSWCSKSKTVMFLFTPR